MKLHLWWASCKIRSINPKDDIADYFEDCTLNIRTNEGGRFLHVNSYPGSKSTYFLGNVTVSELTSCTLKGTGSAIIKSSLIPVTFEAHLNE